MNANRLARLAWFLVSIWLAGCSPSMDPVHVIETVIVEKEAIATVEVMEAPAATEPPAAMHYIGVPTPMPELMRVVASGAANVYSGPGETFTSYGQIAPGTAAQVAGASPDMNWYLIYVSMDASPAGIGWVSAGQVWVENMMETTIIQPPPLALRLEIPRPAANLPQVIFQIDTAVRSGPGVNYPILGQAVSDARAEAAGLSADGGWYVIKIPDSYAPGGLGWVDSGAVSPENAGELPVALAPPVEEPLSAPPPMPDASSLITTVNQRVRSGPGEDFLSYGLLWSATRAEFIGMSPDYNWYAIRMYVQDAPDGMGWLPAEATTAMVFGDVPIIEP